MRKAVLISPRVSELDACWPVGSWSSGKRNWEASLGKVTSKMLLEIRIGRSPAKPIEYGFNGLP